MDGKYNENILRSLRRIQRAIDLYSKDLANRYNLTTPQLLCLRQLGANGSTTASQLAREVALSQATITGILDRLEARGLITRRRDAQDRRRVNLEVTEEGRSLVEKAPLPLQQRFATRLMELPEVDQALIDGVLSRIVEMMEAEDLEAAPMMVAGPIGADSLDVAGFLDHGESEGQPD